MIMRAPAVLLNIIVAASLSGYAGYVIANKEQQKMLASLRQEHQATLLREQEVRAQLEAALSARAALEQQSQQLQAGLNERLRRLEELAAKLTLPPLPPEENAPVNSAPMPQSDNLPEEGH